MIVRNVEILVIPSTTLVRSTSNTQVTLGPGVTLRVGGSSGGVRNYNAQTGTNFIVQGTVVADGNGAGSLNGNALTNVSGAKIQLSNCTLTLGTDAQVNAENI